MLIMFSTRDVSISVAVKSSLPSLTAPNSFMASIILVAKSFRFLPKVPRSEKPVNKDTKPPIGSICELSEANLVVISTSLSTLLASVSSSEASLRVSKAELKPVTKGVSVAPNVAKSVVPISASTRPPIGSIFGVKAESLLVTSQTF